MASKATAQGIAAGARPTVPNLMETQQRMMTEAMAANTRIAIPFLRAAFSPWMMATKTGIFYGPNPLMMMTGFSKNDERN